jgi:hypothetical protein
MKATVNEIHAFLEANLPGYERKDQLKVCEFFLDMMGLPVHMPLRNVALYFDNFKKFVCIDWQGQEERQYTVQPTGHGQCVCGGTFKKRKNSRDNTFFLGCSNYPLCKNTREFVK